MTTRYSSSREPWAVSVVVLDLDDTLYLERDYVLSGFRAADAWLVKTVGIRGFIEAATGCFLRGVRGTIFNQALEELGRPPEPSLVTELVKVYRAHVPDIALLPDAVDALSWLKDRCRLALLTDGYADVQRRKIRALGLEHRIPLRIVTDDFGRAFWKPSPHGFRHIMDQLGGAPGHFVYVADNPRKDFIGCRQLGWRTIRVRRPGGEHAGYDSSVAEMADVEVSSLTELPRVIQPADSLTRTASASQRANS